MIKSLKMCCANVSVLQYQHLFKKFKLVSSIGSFDKQLQPPLLLNNIHNVLGNNRPLWSTLSNII